MSQSIKQISESLGINRNKVYRIIEKLDIQPENADGTKTYSDQAIKDIKAYLKRVEKDKKGLDKDANQDARTAEQTPPGNQDVIDALKEVIRIQAETINDLRTQIEALTEMVKHEQEIRLGQLALEANHKPNARKRAWTRLFHRGEQETET